MSPCMVKSSALLNIQRFNVVLLNNCFLFAPCLASFVGSENIVANLPGLEINNASAWANAYSSLDFHTYSTGALSPNFQIPSVLPVCANVLVNTELLAIVKPVVGTTAL